jgi:transposase-like protein
MSQSKRARYTLEYKAEAVRLVRSGQSIAMVARTLGVADQTLHNLIKADDRESLADDAAWSETSAAVFAPNQPHQIDGGSMLAHPFLELPQPACRLVAGERQHGCPE